MSTGGAIKAIAFDLDHTLYDRNLTLKKLAPHFIQRFGELLSAPIPADELEMLLRETDMCSTYDESGWRGMHERLCRSGIFRVPPEYETFYKFICETFPSAIQPYPDTYEVLRLCRRQGYRLAFITNGHHALQADKIARMSLWDYLDEIIVCDLDAGLQCKPDPHPFAAMAKRLGIPVQQIAYVGDNPINDIEGARNAGMIPIWLSVMGYWSPEVEPTPYEIRTLSQLPAVLQQISKDGGAYSAHTPCASARKAREIYKMEEKG